LGKGYGDLPGKYSAYEAARVAVLPVPFDLTSTWVKGADKGPAALIEASANMELYDIESGAEAYKKGICTVRPVRAKTARRMVEGVYRRASELLDDGKFVVTLGGEHTVSLGAIRAHAERHPGMGVLHLDAHTDMRDSYHGDPLSHACVMQRAKEYVSEIVSVGIRSMDSSELTNVDMRKVFLASRIHRDRAWVGKAVRLLPRDVYLTIDLDVFDPGIMPSTGTPEPGGLGWYDVLGLIEAVARKRDIVGFDIVELCPSEDKAPDFLAAKLLYKALTFIFGKS
jgi:agmatinase